MHPSHALSLSPASQHLLPSSLVHRLLPTELRRLPTCPHRHSHPFLHHSPPLIDPTYYVRYQPTHLKPIAHLPHCTVTLSVLPSSHTDSTLCLSFRFRTMILCMWNDWNQRTSQESAHSTTIFCQQGVQLNTSFVAASSTAHIRHTSATVLASEKWGGVKAMTGRCGKKHAV